MAKKNIPAVVFKENKLYIAKTLGIELASQGKTKKEALANLKEALELLMEDEKQIRLPELPKNPELASISYA